MMLTIEKPLLLLALALIPLSAWSDDVAPLNPMPYANIDWMAAEHIHTTSHGHQTDQATLDRAVAAGLRFLSISNYYPSAPWWPMKDVRANQFHVRQEHAVVVNGTLAPGPFDWNAILTDPESGWADELPEEQRARLPFTLGENPFTNVPEGLLEAPNAEHHSFSNSRLHACAPGSAFQSGTFDVRNYFKTVDHGYAMGVGQTWQEGFTRMFAALIVPDGGGVIVNHPKWSSLSQEDVMAMLDFDPRVLGIEVFNHTTVNQHGYQDTVGSEALWDAILATGRQCFGFFVPDHVMQQDDAWMGRNVLLVEAFTVEDCLRAYRQGRFYGLLKGTGLRFESIEVGDAAFTVKTNGARRIEFYTEQGLARAVSAAEATFEIPQSPEGGPAVTFVRARALDGQGEILYSQPTLYRRTGL